MELLVIYGKTKEELKGFTKGMEKEIKYRIGSALMRQVIYAATRMGLFYTAIDVAKDKYGKVLNPIEKALVSLGAGATAAFIATPFDLAMIRFQVDGSLPPAERRNYKNWMDALSKIVKQEGFFNLWKGAAPTIVRAMGINLGKYSRRIKKIRNVGPL